MTQLPNALVATVEFMERVWLTFLPPPRERTLTFFCFLKDSVLAALTKDKKRVGGEEIAVHLAWQSTLYVTNFPEKADDTYIRNLFTKVRAIYSTYYMVVVKESTVRYYF